MIPVTIKIENHSFDLFEVFVLKPDSVGVCVERNLFLLEQREPQNWGNENRAFEQFTIEARDLYQCCSVAGNGVARGVSILERKVDSRKTDFKRMICMFTLSISPCHGTL